MTDFETGVAAYILHLQNHMNTRPFPKTVVPEYLSKFIRITEDGRSVIAFVVAVDGYMFPKGTILKAASWKAPAKNFARGSVLEPASYQHHSTYGL